MSYKMTIMDRVLMVVVLWLVMFDSVRTVSNSPECRDETVICKWLIQTVPNYCQSNIHSNYALANCRQSCDLCDVMEGTKIGHGRNLIMSQAPKVKSYYVVSKMLSLQGDPTTWINNRKPQVTYISAPHYTWDFKALGFDFHEETLYWSESENKKIQSLVLNGSKDTRTHFIGTSPEVNGLTIDWLSKNIYFTDALYNWIIMLSANPNQPVYKIIIQENLDNPHGIALYPEKGYLIWSDWGDRPKIEMSDFLGQNRRTLVETDISKPCGIAVNYDDNSLYWVDTAKATVEVIKFNGQDRRVIHQEDGTSFYDVALFNDYIFVTDRGRGMLKVYNHKQSLVSFTLQNLPYDIIMYDESRQPGNASDCDDLGCEQLCVVDPLTGAKCLCGEGYVPEDELSKSCKPSMKFVHPSHIYAIKDSICQYPANIADMSLLNVTLDSQCFLEDRQGYITLTFDARENMLYYFSNNTKTISRLPLEVGSKSKVLTGGTGVVKGMSLDWVSGNLYWTDSTNGQIKVSRKNGSYQMVILDNLTNPMGIVVHPGRGQIFWTDHGHLPDIGASVQKANMDGSNRQVILDTNIGEPNHLFIDFEKNALYWTDSILNHIRKLDLSTEEITVIYELEKIHFYGLSFFKDFILWTDTEDLNGIHIARLDKKEKVRGIIHPRNGLAADLITFDIVNQPSFNNTCMEGISNCSQICLISRDNTSKCSCGVGYELASDGLTCLTSPVLDNFLLVNDAYQKQIFQVNLKTAVVESVGLQPTHEPIALAYDPFETKVYWSDNKVNLIKEATLDGKYEKTVMLFNNASMCDGLVVDYINKLLFYTDTGNDVIGVVSLSNYDLYTHIVTSDLDEPRDIVVHPNQGIIYWSDWGAPGRIDQANMDGSEREILVEFNTTAWPNGLALDIQENKLYWVDAYADRISVIDLGSKEITILIEEQEAHYFSIDVVGLYLYVTDWKTNYLRRMRKTGGPLTQFGPSSFTRLYGIKGYNSTESFTGLSVCVNSACEHLCLPKKNNQFTCRCSLGYVEDGPYCDQKLTTETPITIPPVLDTSSTSSSTTAKTTTTTTILTTQQQSSTTSITESLTSQQTSSPSSTISLKPATSTMLVPKISETTTEEPTPNVNKDITSTQSSIEQTTVVPEKKDTSIININGTSGENATVLKFTGGDSTSALSATLIGLIVAGVMLLIAVVVVGAVLYRRRYKYAFSHGRLKEEQNPADFYKIAFADRERDNVTFDTGIENPTYDCLNDNTTEVKS